ncbi:ATP-binding protein [Paenibacillus sp. YYML68]|uniref:ATP-binding protein n=1 Tax=Paenibacillus sp. YYML68 TaxID=2909250 RepID=UPI0024911FB2|nr:ATP-binding protein [Paenibacillus sp. YYML68]
MQKIPVVRDKRSSDIEIISSDEVMKIECIRDREFLIYTAHDKFYWAASLEGFEEFLFEENFRLIDQMTLVNMNCVTNYDSRKGIVTLQADSDSTMRTASAAWIQGDHIVKLMSLIQKMKKLEHGMPDEEDDKLFETILAQEEDHRFARSYAMIKALYEKRKTEILLEESELRNKSLFVHNPDPICSLNLNGLITSVNPAMIAVTGYTEKDLLHKTIGTLILPEHYPQWYNFFHDTIQGATPQYELAFQHKQGKRIELSVHSFPIYVGKQIAGIYMIGQDISERKRAEEMLIRSEKLSIVGQLAAGVAHEIRNPLTSLKGFVQLMQTRVQGFDHYFNIMKEELDRINFIVSEFLVIAKPQSIAYEPSNAESIVLSTVMLLGGQAAGRNVEIEVDTEPNLPPIICNENQIKQVFINVLNNSIDSMNEGGTIRIELRRLDDRRVLLRFMDEGCGIPEDRLPKLGEPFYTTKEKGTGLGLMVTFRIIEDHGGEMKIYSQVGVGTTVEIVLRAAESE